jgi:amino acid transporter
MNAEAAVPSRKMGLMDVTLFMVTAGCSLQWTAVAAGAGPSALTIWLLGGLGMFLPLAICIVFLGSRYPDEGGLYAWSRRAFGPLAAFMTGWTYWTGTLAYLPSVLYFAAGSALLYSADSDANAATPAYFVSFSLVVLGVSVALNVRGLHVAKWLNGSSAVARVVGAGLLLALALASWRRFGSATLINWHTVTPGFRFADVVFWSTIAFVWTGPEAASFMGAEIREPRRTIPRALALAAPAIAAIYILGTASVLLVIPPEHASGVYGVSEAIRTAAAKLGLAWLIPLGAVCLAMDRAGSACLWIGALARIPASAGVDHYLPPAFARLHPRYHTPAVAIWLQAIVVALIVVLGQSGTTVRGAYNVLIEMMVVSSMMPFLFLFGAAIRLSAGPGAKGEVRVPGGRAVVVAAASVGFATTAGSMLLAFIPPPDEANRTLAVIKIAGLTAILLLAGLALYVAGTVRARRRALAPATSETA